VNYFQETLEDWGLNAQSIGELFLQPKGICGS
jgi:hypothetical protein